MEGRGNKWLEIGEAMGRMGEACRDRWRTIGLVHATSDLPTLCLESPMRVSFLRMSCLQSFSAALPWFLLTARTWESATKQMPAGCRTQGQVVCLLHDAVFSKPVARVQGSARKTGPWDEQEAKALTQEVQRYMELKQGARAQRAAVAGQVTRSVCRQMWQLDLWYMDLEQGARAQRAAVADQVLTCVLAPDMTLRSAIAGQVLRLSWQDLTLHPAIACWAGVESCLVPDVASPFCDAGG